MSAGFAGSSNSKPLSLQEMLLTSTKNRRAAASLRVEGLHHILSTDAICVIIMSTATEISGETIVDVYMISPDSSGIYGEYQAIMQPHDVANNEESQYLHRHDAYEIMYILQGHVDHYIEGRTLTHNPGDIVILNHNVLHAERFHDNSLAVYITFNPQYLSPDDISSLNGTLAAFLSEAGSDTKSKQYLYYQPALDSNIDVLADNIIDELLQKKSGYRYIVKGNVLRFLEILDNNRLFTVDVISERLTDSAALFKSIELYLQKQLWNSSIKKLSNEFHYSANYLAKLVKRFTGLSFTEYCIEKKLAYMLIKLEKTDESVINLIGNLGYSNRSYFYSLFKKAVRMTPQEYRNKYR